jgi:folate-binding protein YgfZ
VAETQTVVETPLAALHRSAGAKMGVWFGCELPDHWGDAAAEERHAIESVALIDKNYRTYLSFTGPDRVRYLNAILTNDIKGLAERHGTVSLLLNPQGHILAEVETYAFADRLLCVSYAMIRQRLVEWLDKYIIMDDVTLTDETEKWGTLALEGPKAAAVAKELTGVELAGMDELASVDAEVPRSAHKPSASPMPCRVVRRSLGNVAGAEFVVERGDLEGLWKILDAAVARQGGGPMGYAALSARRLAQGVAWFGYDFGEKQIPHEAGLETSHISYTKGCYTGQEIVERVRSRGQVNRRRVGLIFSGEGIPVAGEPLTAEGKEVGFVTRAAKSVAFDSPVGMGYARKENNAPGSELQWARGTARVADLAGELSATNTKR